MKKIPSYIISAFALLGIIVACAKQDSGYTYTASKRYFDAWISLNYPESSIVGTVSDVVVVEDTPGEGAEIQDSTYIFVKYTVRTIDGTIEESTDSEVNKQLGNYTYNYFYGPQPWILGYEGLAVGVERGIKGNAGDWTETEVGPMKLGGQRTFIVPCWLGNTTRYDNEEDYLKNGSSTSNYIYDIVIVDATCDIVQWEFDRMTEYSELYLDGMDTTSYGFYYKQITPPSSETEMSDDTTMYINYVGRRLDGMVFDTNIADTAKMYRFYDETEEYGPTQINWNSDEESITMGEDEDEVITGFARALTLMKNHEKGICMFYSALGYSYSGSGYTIPPYAPLIFEIEFVDSEDE